MYRSVQLQAPEGGALQLDARACSSSELLAPDRLPEHAARLQPLREYTLLMRDTRYDLMLDQ